MTDERIETLLEDIRLLDEERFQMAQALRQRILALSPTIREEVKYGGLLFSVDKPFCGIFSYARHLSIEFSAGAALQDEHGLLEGQGKLRRHIKLSSLQDMRDKPVGAYLEQAFRHCAAP
ncbi:DUF1801 domain-containing protein [Pseudomonas sp. ABC1]|uniref:DUF1801 domain-containing protein n=1 Tax=Pseudomonas sp. ABC1 TaxID=2748080 RepID=UPI0015C35BA4|nr:DUF1801 domain-containing protein [Pseudomonas sp. ABC1]QLF94718.1 DUF1801 domain-containing protein [Pseudomonas sp. ABC1]